ncbi:LOW QUALITY PROTEIN: zinc finger SWIM domain-containing protein 1 [Pithys albifrons albifrons]|uniref:LOW QUALITY PROTEIN: zinc finger SWIM domain-containing protein 1 n=1 Tax=Pithys albifrons albifrons TaxID=3385563 RepID=UPI003A5CF5A9
MELEVVLQGLSQQQPETPQALLQSEPPAPQSLLYPVVKLEATETSEDDSEEQINQRTEEGIRKSLSDILKEPPARLCLSELAMVQKSMQLIGTRKDALRVQILEDAHRVDLKGLSSCTCHISQAFRLVCPAGSFGCAESRSLCSWRCSVDRGRGDVMPVRPGESADGFLEVLKSSWKKALDKSQVVSASCSPSSGEEFEHWYRTFWELSDSWIGPNVRVKL